MRGGDPLEQVGAIQVVLDHHRIGAGHRLAGRIGVQRAQLLSIELPVAETVSEILSGALAPKDAVPRLMARPFKME